MGWEKQHEAKEHLCCKICCNEIIITFIILEYPTGNHATDEIEIEGGELINPIAFTTDFWSDEY
jgi:hypothetical protein